MTYYLSINNFFYPNYSREWVYLLEKYNTDKIISGIEFFINVNNKIDRIYITDIINKYIINKYNFGFHMNDLDNRTIYDICNELLFYNTFTKNINKKLLITLHPMSDVITSINYINLVLKFIKMKNLNLIICLENLNDKPNRKRLHMNDINKIIDNLNELVYITWDIGHELDNPTYKLQKYNLLRNIHLHDANKNRNESLNFTIEDHMPFYYNTVDIGRVKKYLKKIKYNGPIIFEIGLSNLSSFTSTFENQMKEYINNVRFYDKQKG